MKMIQLGILGGGQLGLMTHQAKEKNKDLGIDLHFLDKNPACSCSSLPGFTAGDVQDPEKVYEWGLDKDIISYEWEHISLEGIKKLEKAGKKVFPKPKTLEIIKDKGLQKQFYAENAIPTADFELWDKDRAVKMDFPLVQKARTGGYDGKGVQIVTKKEDLWPVPSVLELKIPLKTELAIIIARNESGETQVSPLVDMVFDDSLNLVSEVVCPVDYGQEIKEKAEKIAQKIAEKLDLVGILAVEFFLTDKNELLVNEVAPRPHNSGHLSIEGWEGSQFLLFLESICGKKLTKMESKTHTGMINVLGKGKTEKTWGNFADHLPKNAQEIPEVKEKGVYVHDYRKKEDNIGRKMGHITITGANRADLDVKLAWAKAELGV